MFSKMMVPNLKLKITTFSTNNLGAEAEMMPVPNARSLK
jgi:hypothetical protein